MQSARNDKFIWGKYQSFCKIAEENEAKKKNERA
jgi:hypothetical protein